MPEKPPSEQTSQPGDGFTARYLALLREQVNKVYILGEPQRRDLQKVFVELTITEEYERPLHALYLGMMDAEMRRRRALFPASDDFSPAGMRDEKTVKRKVKPAELLRERTHAIVMGAPGCGKTTLLRFLALQIIAEEKEPRRLPVFLELKTVTEKDFKRAGNKLADLLFDKAVAGRLNLNLKTAQGKRFKESFFARLAKGEVAIFLDGLDEVRGASFFDALCGSVNEFVNSACGENSVIISTRPYALQSRFDDLKKMEIDPLDERQIEAFLNHYYNDAQLTGRLLQTYRQRREMRELMSVPFLLGVLVRLHRDKKQTIVTADRLEIYRQIVQDLVVELDTEKSVHRTRFKLEDPRGMLRLDFLKWLACERLLVDEMSAAGIAQESERLIFTGDLLIEKAQQFVAAQQLNCDPYLLAEDVIATPLLREVGADVYAFVHLTIQEYLSAMSLAKRKDRERVFFTAYFNTTLVEMEVLPMTLGLANDADALYTMIERMPESLTFAGFRLGARGLGYGARISQQHLIELTDKLIEIVRGERAEDDPYLDKMLRSFSAPGASSTEYVVNQVADLLSDESTNVRRRAASALEKIKDERAVGALIETLKGKDESMRQNAASALGSIGGDYAIKALIDTLNDRASYVRRKAATALGKVGRARAVGALIDALKDEDNGVRGRAAYALGKIRDGHAVEALIEVLKDEDSVVRRNAAAALEEIKNQHMVGALIDGLKNEDNDVRGRAASTLEEIMEERAVGALIKALKDKYSDVRWNAAQRLGEIKDERAVGALIEALKDKYSDVRSSAASALGKIGSERAVGALMIVLKDKDPFMRKSAVYALGKIMGERAIEALMEMLKDEDASVRRITISALGEIKDERVIGALIKALKDKDRAMRRRAASALEKIKDEHTVEALLEALKDEDSRVRRIAVSTLGEIKNECTVEALIEALKNEDDRVRRIAVSALGEKKDERAVGALIEALTDHIGNVRRGAADALAKMSEGGLPKGLAKALSEREEFTKLKATQVIAYYSSDPHLLDELSNLAAGDPSEEVRNAAITAKEKFLCKLRVLGKDADVRNAELESEIRAKYEQATRAKKAQIKGKALEELVALLFSSIAGFTEAGRNVNTETEEIDVVFRNESRDPFWQRASQLLLFECKNWHAQRVGKNEFVLFKEKIINRGGYCRLGFLICTEVFAETITKEMLRVAQSDILVVPINGDELRRLVEAPDRNELLKQYVIDATMK